MDYYTVVSLDNQYNIRGIWIDGQYDGGDQSWRSVKTTYTDDTEERFNALKENKYYRLWQMGCGIIALSDVELYMTMQNSGYHLSYSNGFADARKNSINWYETWPELEHYEVS